MKYRPGGPGALVDLEISDSMIEEVSRGANRQAHEHKLG